jgi:hypothetical protein
MRLQSSIGKAVSYALGQWESLEVYLQDAQIEIDNNLVENAIRPTALGKNYEQSGIMQSSTASDRDFCRWALATVESSTALVSALCNAITLLGEWVLPFFGL